MRIIAGRLRRKTIRVPKGKVTRPSTDRTRESVFNLVVNRVDLEGGAVLDLFAGTGALGFEALSRGARVVTFVESSAEILKFTRENADELGVAPHARYVKGDALVYLKRYSGPRFRLILADPPYDLEGLEKLPELALPLLDDQGIFVLEHDVRHNFDDHPLLDTSRAYGRTIVSVFNPELADAPSGKEEADDEPDSPEEPQTDE